MTCKPCYNSMIDRAAPRVPLCPICRDPINSIEDSTYVMVREVSVNDGTILAHDLCVDYPYGCLLFGSSVQIADSQMVQVVREAMQAVECKSFKPIRFKSGVIHAINSCSNANRLC